MLAQNKQDCYNNFMEKLSQSLEDYLEIIYNKIQEHNEVKAVDIARELKVSRASVTEALNKLRDKKFINYEKYGDILITQEGIKKAKEIVSLHKELTLFFENIGIENKEAEEVACKIEHIVSKNIKKRISAFNKFIKENPNFKF